MSELIYFYTVYVKIENLDFPIEFAQISKKDYDNLCTNPHNFQRQFDSIWQFVKVMFPNITEDQILIYYVRYGCNYMKFYFLKDSSLELVDLSE